MPDSIPTDPIGYLSAFRDSNLKDYSFAMREYKVGGNSGYDRFYGSDVVVQTMIDIFGTLDEVFSDLSIPAGFTTPGTRLAAFKNFLVYLKRRGVEFEEIVKQILKEERRKSAPFGEWTDSELLPEPFKEIDRILHEVIEAMEHVLILSSKDAPSAVRSVHEQLVTLLEGFPRYAAQLQKRHQNRATLKVLNEYDVQDALHALLKLHFPDVRPEDAIGRSAGAGSRVDFVIGDYEILIEVKMTRKNLRDKEIGEQLAVDVFRYKKHLNCKSIYFFIYDPQHFLRNPSELIKTFGRRFDDVDQYVIIAPQL